MYSELPALGLSEVMSQLQQKDPVFWTADVLARAEVEYRRFLALAKARPTVRLVPSRLVDEVWHRHILNTRQYAEDCRNYFGFFLHHNPGNKADDAVAWQATLSAYAEFFGEMPGDAWQGDNAICDAGGCDTCTEYAEPKPVEAVV